MKTHVGDIEINCALSGFCFGFVRVTSVKVSMASEQLSKQIEISMQELEIDEHLKSSIRDMLRFGKYKPTGRGKPACEYLFKAAKNQKFPKINNLVDSLNLVSLSHQLPISVIDTDLAESSKFQIRRGKIDETYIFNAGGQVIGLTDLLLVASLPDDIACANPIKDSLRTKLTQSTRNVLAVIYGTPELDSQIRAATEQLAVLYRQCCDKEGEVSTAFFGSETP